MPKELPANPSLENLRNQAKALLKTHQQGSSEANSRIREFHPEWSRGSIEQVQDADVSLSDAQWVVAREYGFDSWAKLKHYIESQKRPARILFALDGNPATARRTIKLLKDKGGYETIVASNGMEALRMAGESKPDMILLGIRLPDIDGLEVCRRLKADKATADVPVVCTSAYWSVERVIKAFRSGAADCIPEGFTKEILLERVKINLGIED